MTVQNRVWLLVLGAVAICLPATSARAVAGPQLLVIKLGTPSKSVPFMPGRKTSDPTERFDLRRYAFNFPIEQAAIGDIDNDGQGEVVVFSDYEKRVGEFLDDDYLGYSVTFALSIYKPTPQGLILLWSDLGSLGYGYNTEMSGIDSLGGIGDIDGSGKNGLIVRPGVSDVSFPVELLYWQGDKLVKVWSTDNLDRVSASPSLPNIDKISGYGVLGVSVGVVDGGGVRGLAGMLTLTSSGPSSKPGQWRNQLVYGNIRDGTFVVTDIPSSTSTILDEPEQRFQPPLGGIERGGRSEVLRELAVLEGNTPPEAAKAAIWTLISALAPSPGEPGLNNQDFDDPAIVSRFRAVLLKEKNPDVIQSLIRLFRFTKGDEFAPALEELLKKRQPDAIQKEATAGLASLRTQEIVPDLIQRIMTGDAESVGFATVQLCKIHTEQSTQYLIKSLNRPNSRLLDTIQELIRRQAREAVPSLKVLLKSHDEGQGLAATSALLALDPSYAREILTAGEDPFAMRMLAGSLSIVSSGGLSIETLEKMAMTKTEDIRIRKNALLSLKAGRYCNVNYVIWLHREKREEPFLRFLEVTADDPQSDPEMRKTSREILEIPYPH